MFCWRFNWRVKAKSAKSNSKSLKDSDLELLKLCAEEWLREPFFTVNQAGIIELGYCNIGFDNLEVLE